MLLAYENLRFLINICHVAVEGACLTEVVCAIGSFLLLRLAGGNDIVLHMLRPLHLRLGQKESVRSYPGQMPHLTGNRKN